MCLFFLLGGARGILCEKRVVLLKRSSVCSVDSAESRRTSQSLWRREGDKSNGRGGASRRLNCRFSAVFSRKEGLDDNIAMSVRMYRPFAFSRRSTAFARSSRSSLHVHPPPPICFFVPHSLVRRRPYGLALLYTCENLQDEYTVGGDAGRASPTLPANGNPAAPLDPEPGSTAASGGSGGESGGVAGAKRGSSAISGEGASGPGGSGAGNGEGNGVKRPKKMSKKAPQGVTQASVVATLKRYGGRLASKVRMRRAAAAIDVMPVYRMGTGVDGLVFAAPCIGVVLRRHYLWSLGVEFGCVPRELTFLISGC